jgi:LysR family hydrogen peroxide-inducible transcriptional activator
MNFQQLEYIVAIETYKNFALAAEKCFVTQPTLSTMIQKLEEELDVKIFDRSKHPVKATQIGEEIIKQARQILNQSKQLKHFVKDFKGSIEGELRIGIIPTVAPYLLPMFLNKVVLKYPNLTLNIEELTTQQIINKLGKGAIDLGILATPLHQKDLVEYPVYYERFFVYASDNLYSKWKKKYILPRDIKVIDLLLLEEGHCLRNQIINLCEIKKGTSGLQKVKFEAGSLETLINMVDEGYGLTLLPELALKYLPKDKQHRIKEFKAPEPVREISIITHKNFERKKIIEALKECLVMATDSGSSKKNKSVVKIE